MSAPATFPGAATYTPFTSHFSAPAPLANDELTDDDLELVVGGLERARLSSDVLPQASRAPSGT